MVTNDELFRKLMRFSKEVRFRRHRGEGPEGEGRGCGMHEKMREMMEQRRAAAENGEAPAMPMPPMPGMLPREGMPPMPPFEGMPQMPGMMPPVPPMPPHCGPWGRGPHGPGGRRRGMSRELLLVLIAERPDGAWQKDIAWEADINASSASELIGRLEADGYLVRETDENDRRAVLLKLTEAGQARAAELKAEREAFVDELFSKLTDEEKETLSALLDKLLN